jgi:small basic protein
VEIYLHPARLTDTPVGLWGQTAIVAACASLFFFNNTIVASEELQDRHPTSGFLNIFFAVFMVAPALTFLPQILGIKTVLYSLVLVSPFHGIR